MHGFGLLCLLAQASYSLAASQAQAVASVAHQLPAGEYTIRNVGRGQTLVGNRDNLYVGSGSPVTVTVAPHNTGSNRHSVFGVGGKGDRKCVSAAWTSSQGNDGTASMYSCALGSLAQGNAHSGLRQEKQAFFLVPASGKAKRDEMTTFEKRGKHHRKHAKSHKKASKHHTTKHHSSGSSLSTASGKGSYGPYYIIAADHLEDQAPRALDAESVTAMGQRVCKLAPWKKGSTEQEWLFVRS